MVYKANSGNIDFEAAIRATITIERIPCAGKRRSSYDTRMEMYATIESSLIHGNIAQSLPEYLMTVYWLRGMNTYNIADELTEKTKVALGRHNVLQMTKELKIPTRGTGMKLKAA